MKGNKECQLPFAPGNEKWILLVLKGLSRGKHNGYVRLKLSNKQYSNFILNPNWKLVYQVIKTLFQFFEFNTVGTNWMWWNEGAIAENQSSDSSFASFPLSKWPFSRFPRSPQQRLQLVSRSTRKLWCVWVFWVVEWTCVC